MLKPNVPGRKLNQVWLPRLSPVMRAANEPVVRPPHGVPIDKTLAGMGNYEQVDTVDPRGQALWSNLYRIGTAGALSRVAPFGPSAFSGDEGESLPKRIMSSKAFWLSMLGAIGYMWYKDR